MMTTTSPSSNGAPPSQDSPVAGFEPHIPAPEEDGMYRKIQEATFNMLQSRAEMVRRLTDPNRDLYNECGFPKGQISIQDYQLQYQRNPYAARVIELMPREAFRVQFTVYESEDGDTLTPFEDTWDGLSRQLRMEESYYKDEYGSIIMNLCLAAAILSRVERHGCIVIGIEGDDDLSQPAEFKKGPEATRKLMYLTPFSSYHCRVSETDQTPGRRYGMPLYYTITFTDPQVAMSGGPNLQLTNLKVHWTRVVHLAGLGDEESSSKLYHVPPLESVYNPCLSAEKVACSSGEMFYRGAFMGLAFSTHPNLGPNARINKERTKEMMEDYTWGLQRWIGLEGMSVTPLATQVSDPSPQVKVNIDAICLKKEIPNRIFIGSERGELSSTQDDDTWKSRVEAYQWNKLTPNLVIPLVDRLINLNVLPEPPNGYSIDWPSMRADDPHGEIQLSSARTATLVQYDQSSLKEWFDRFDFLTRVMGFEDEEATAILDNGIKAEEERQATQIDDGGHLLDDAAGLTGMAKLFEMAKAGTLSEEQLKQIIIAFFKVSEQRADELIADGIKVDKPAPPTSPANAPPRPGQVPVPGHQPPANSQVPGAVVPVPSATQNAAEYAPEVSALNAMWSYEEDCPVVNAKNTLTGGRWVTTDSGAHLYIKDGSVVAGNPHVVEYATIGGKRLPVAKRLDSPEKQATAQAVAHLGSAVAADKAGDKQRARNLRAAAYGYHKAADHYKNGDHRKAEAVKRVADEYASGKRNVGKKSKS